MRKKSPERTTIIIIERWTLFIFLSVVSVSTKWITTSWWCLTIRAAVYWCVPYAGFDQKFFFLQIQLKFFFSLRFFHQILCIIRIDFEAKLLAYKMFGQSVHGLHVFVSWSVDCCCIRSSFCYVFFIIIFFFSFGFRSFVRSLHYVLLFRWLFYRGALLHVNLYSCDPHI